MEREHSICVQGLYVQMRKVPKNKKRIPQYAAENILKVGVTIGMTY